MTALHTYIARNRVAVACTTSAALRESLSISNLGRIRDYPPASLAGSRHITRKKQGPQHKPVARVTTPSSHPTADKPHLYAANVVHTNCKLTHELLRVRLNWSSADEDAAEEPDVTEEPDVDGSLGAAFAMRVGLIERRVALRSLVTPSPDGARIGLTVRTGLAEREAFLNTATLLERAVILTLLASLQRFRASETSNSSFL
jgi:hypothetical protein